MLDIEANKAIVRRYFETFNSGHLEQLHEILAQDYGDRLEGHSAGIDVIRRWPQRRPGCARRRRVTSSGRCWSWTAA
jgi:ketosteroid isomerase-like protein